MRNWEVGSGCHKRFYRHLLFWFIYIDYFFETSGTASCGTTGSNIQRSGAINVPEASICRSLHLPQNSFTWSALVAILSPAGLFGAWLAPLAVSRLGIFGFQFWWSREFFITAFSSRIALLINVIVVLPWESWECKTHHRSGKMASRFYQWLNCQSSLLNLSCLALFCQGLLTSLRSTWIFFVISGSLFPLAANTSMGILLFAAGRIVGGFGAGAATVLVPLYLGRIAPLNLRGAIGNLHQARNIQTFNVQT